MNLEYKINKGKLKDFEKDFNKYYCIKMSVSYSEDNKKLMKKWIRKKYNQTENEISHNMKVHADKICSRYNPNWKLDGQ